MEFNFILLLVTIGCNSETNSLLDKAETLMQEQPKDALGLLDSLKQHPLKGKAINARFALLYSMALDKNYIDVTDDSLISIAENWYANKGSVKEKFMSHYYKGVVNKNAHEYPKAITAFSQALKFEEELNDNYLLGQLYNQMSSIYEKHYDYKKSLEFRSHSYKLFSEAGKTKHKNYALLGIASAYWDMADSNQDEIYNKSEYYFNKALEEGVKTNYSILTTLASRYLFIQYVERELYDKAEKILEDFNLRSNKQSAVLYAALAKLYYYQNDITEGKKMMSLAWATSKNATDTAKLHQWEYNIFKFLKDYNLALDALESSINFQNKLVRYNLQQPILGIQKNLLEKDLELSQYKLKTEQEITALTALIIFIVTCITAYCTAKILSEKNKKLANYMDILDELKRSFLNSQEIMSIKDRQINMIHSDMLVLVCHKINLINNLSITFYEKQSSPKAKEIFIKEVEKIIADFKTNDDNFKLMEYSINASNNNLLQNIYNETPSLSNDEKKLLCYIYAGFSSKAISVFLNIPLETVYNRKSRLMAKTGLSKAKKQQKSDIIENIPKPLA